MRKIHLVVVAFIVLLAGCTFTPDKANQVLVKDGPQYYTSWGFQLACQPYFVAGAPNFGKDRPTVDRIFQYYAEGNHWPLLLKKHDVIISIDRQPVSNIREVMFALNRDVPFNMRTEIDRLVEKAGWTVDPKPFMAEQTVEQKWERHKRHLISIKRISWDGRRWVVTDLDILVRPYRRLLVDVTKNNQDNIEFFSLIATWRNEKNTACLRVN
jgi:hypothetical protein